MTISFRLSANLKRRLMEVEWYKEEDTWAYNIGVAGSCLSQVGNQSPLNVFCVTPFNDRPPQLEFEIFYETPCVLHYPWVTG